MSAEQRVIIRRNIYRAASEDNARAHFDAEAAPDCIEFLLPTSRYNDGFEFSLQRWASEDNLLLRVDIVSNPCLDIWVPQGASPFSFWPAPVDGPHELYPGELLIIPPISEEIPTFCVRMRDALRVSLSERLTRRAAKALHGEDISSERRFQPQRTRDGLIKNLVMALFAASSNLNRNSQVHVHNIGMALAIHLLSIHHSGVCPAEPKSSVKPLANWRLDNVLEFIDHNLQDDLNLTLLSNVAGLSRMYFSAQFKAATGLSPHNFVLNRRIALSQELLLDPSIAVRDVARLSGFKSQAHYINVFKRIVGCPPGQWRAGMSARRARD